MNRVSEINIARAKAKQIYENWDNVDQKLNNKIIIDYILSTGHSEGLVDPGIKEQFNDRAKEIVKLYIAFSQKTLDGKEEKENVKITKIRHHDLYKSEVCKFLRNEAEHPYGNRSQWNSKIATKIESLIKSDKLNCSNLCLERPKVDFCNIVNEILGWTNYDAFVKDFNEMIKAKGFMQ
ncbi:hypothetical protein R7P80_00145 [Vibrio sp. 2092]|uniref:hypothetical protein n=1 Tax=unclassified Vibrio TaxID=2614977 RepID=UPI0029656B5D|nr:MULTISPECIES: hypothetical protein [unclassified Vibrio]MCA2471183.1 hypothetical protein [Vibrio alginolyticus]MDW1965987.1 hypothetical protein [Vibrio sp. Vb0587]MDW2151203.1 hypothetical protein [Vibrio sp. 2092]